ncbi:MAG: hypothetical protein ACFFC7_07250 [Candidatus Hermodarchaeota archaeon]
MRWRRGSTMWLVLKGSIKTPIVTRKTHFRLEGCQISILNPRRCYYNKINTSKPMYPYSYVCYLGDIEVRHECKFKSTAKQKLAKLLQIKAIGRYTSEGMGQIRWLAGEITTTPTETRRYKRKLRIRKGLPHDLPNNIQKLLHYALLHDFVHTSKHKSKIYVEPQLENIAALQKHHDTSDNPLIQLFQKYEHLAAMITRKVRSPRTSRYNWTARGNIDFDKLAQDIEEVAKQSIWKLYEYIYQSKELKQLNESLEHGHTSLRDHLLIIANLIVQDIQRHVL